MEDSEALLALSALAQETRLRVFRCLVKAGPEGLAAGALATTLGVPPATLSFHLKELVRGGLVSLHREGRSIVYSVEVGGVRALLGFLTQDCCGGNPELCQLDELGEPTCEANGGDCGEST